jgi:hypothetical protein
MIKYKNLKTVLSSFIDVINEKIKASDQNNHILSHNKNHDIPLGDF